jgi:hypothetical protein
VNHPLHEDAQIYRSESRYWVQRAIDLEGTVRVRVLGVLNRDRVMIRGDVLRTTLVVRPISLEQGRGDEVEFTGVTVGIVYPGLRVRCKYLWSPPEIQHVEPRVIGGLTFLNE